MIPANGGIALTIHPPAETGFMNLFARRSIDELRAYASSEDENMLAHKTAVIGDSVGDPFKDTAGPSIHVLIKLLATITLVLAPFFV